MKLQLSHLGCRHSSLAARRVEALVSFGSRHLSLENLEKQRCIIEDEGEKKKKKTSFCQEMALKRRAW